MTACGGRKPVPLTDSAGQYLQATVIRQLGTPFFLHAKVPREVFGRLG
jgi:hypothetical protein